jgi:hypothetical protein
MTRPDMLGMLGVVRLDSGLRWAWFIFYSVVIRGVRVYPTIGWYWCLGAVRVHSSGYCLHEKTDCKARSPHWSDIITVDFIWFWL